MDIRGLTQMCRDGRRGCSSMVRKPTTTRLMLAAVMVVGAAAIAVAGSFASSNVKGATHSANAAAAYVPTGVTAAGANWFWAGGDEANSGYSPLKQINSSNVSKLQVAWNAQLFSPSLTAVKVESQPICCPNNLMIQDTATGAFALNPA